MTTGMNENQRYKGALPSSPSFGETPKKKKKKKKKIECIDPAMENTKSTCSDFQNYISKSGDHKHVLSYKQSS